MTDAWGDGPQDRQDWRTWRAVISMLIALVITGAAAIDFGQPAWVLVGLIGPAALAWDSMARRHRRRVVR